MIPIALVSDARYEGGAERYLLRLAGALDRRRFRPTLVMPDREGLDDLIERGRRAGLDVVRWRRRPEPLAAIELARAVDRLAPRIVHLNMPSPYEMGCGGWALGLSRPERSVVATEHIADIAPSRRRVLQKRLWSGLIERTITISAAHAALLASRHGVPKEKIRVVMNGVEDPGPSPERPDRPLRVAVIGSLEPRKGQDRLLEAAAMALGRGADIEVVLVGAGPSRSALEAAAARAPLSGRVRFTGQLASAAREIASSHIVAVPSRIEGVPFVVAEAMAAGTVPLVSRLPGLDEVVDDGVGRLLPADDASVWADALVELAANPAERARLAAAARARFEQRFTLARMAAGTAAVYAEVLR
ncbi:MAG TPA: glycosyltransferase family 4 protein [Candidatus Eisenbacteria bacterium]